MSLEKLISKEYDGLTFTEPLSAIFRGSIDSYEINGKTIFKMTIETRSILIKPPPYCIIVKFSFELAHTKKIKYQKYLLKNYFGCVSFESLPYYYRKNITIPFQKKSLCKICNKLILNNKDFSYFYYNLDLRRWFSFNKMDERVSIDSVCPNCLKLMKICPICKNENHKSDIYDFLESRNKRVKEIRQSFFSLLKIKDKLIKIKIGIPCCSCFNKIFGIHFSEINPQLLRQNETNNQNSSHSQNGVMLDNTIAGHSDPE